MKNISTKLLILLSTIFFISLTSCIKPPYIDVLLEKYDMNVTSDAQEFDIGVETTKGKTFFMNYLRYSIYREDSTLKEEIVIKKLETKKEVEGPWFEFVIAEDRKSLKVRLKENTTNIHRDVCVFLDSDRNEDKVFPSLFIRQAGKN